MRASVVHVTTRRSGNTARREEALEADVLTLGRATDNSVDLPGLTVALYHASIHIRAGVAWIQTEEGADDLRVNGRLLVTKQLEVGDVITIGHHEIRVIQGSDDFDIALEIEQVETHGGAKEELAARTRMGIEQGILQRRPLSWLAVLVIVGAFLGLPLIFRAEPVGPGEQRSSSPVEQAASVMFRTWSSGPISASHAHFADQCANCHVNAFEKVPDSTCAAAGCHAEIEAHSIGEVGAHAFDNARCASCHTEHAGEHSLAALTDELCMSCHADLAAHYPATNLEPASDFANHHPEFRPSVVTGAGSEDRVRVSLDVVGPASTKNSEGLGENSGLTFPHALHLKGSIRGKDGKETLVCANCHTPQTGGRLFERIVFEDHCQRCHSLAFASSHPEREVPHEKPSVVADEILEFFAARALLAKETENDEALERRRPGGRKLDKQTLETLDWVNDRNDAAVRRFLAEEGACATCHVMENQDGELSVRPIKTVPFAGGERWFPYADFDHKTHTMSTCESCHDARSAQTSAAVILPGIDSCRACHGGGVPTAGKLTSPCVSCHDFHNPGLGPMRKTGDSDSANAPAGTSAGSSPKKITATFPETSRGAKG